MCCQHRKQQQLHNTSMLANHALVLALLVDLVVVADPTMYSAVTPFDWLLVTAADTKHAACAAVVLVWLGGTLVTLPTWLQFRNMLRDNGVGARLQALRMHSVGFTGPIGNLDYYFPALRMLDLSGNNFYGPLPQVTTTGWLYLDVSKQMLTGGRTVCHCSGPG
jgi:hypothetical protein